MLKRRACQTLRRNFCENNHFELLFFAKSSILDVLQGTEEAFVLSI